MTTRTDARQYLTLTLIERLVGVFEVACTHGDMAAQFTTKGELLDAIYALLAELEAVKLMMLEDALQGRKP